MYNKISILHEFWFSCEEQLMSCGLFFIPSMFFLLYMLYTFLTFIKPGILYLSLQYSSILYTEKG